METENSWLSLNKRKLQKAQRLLSPCISERSGVWADFGCGAGVFTAVLFTLLGPKCEIHAVDKSQRALNRLNKNFQDTFPETSLHIQRADFTSPISMPPLDGFILANALHFIRDKDKGRVLEDLSRKLKSGGKIIVVEYNTNRGNYAVPHPLSEDEFLKLARQQNLQNPHIVTKVPSSFLGEMYAGIAYAPEERP
jgi:ubiquinone/menaquinone biosynthesis C-methylase UbiE